MRLLSDYLEDIKKECEYLCDRSSKITIEEFKKNQDLKRAFVRSLEIIGEASKHIPSEIRKKYPQINWKSVVAMRNILAHEYFGIDYEVIWKTVKERIPQLIKVIKNIIKEQKIKNIE